MASRKSVFKRENPKSAMGRAVSQLEAPLSSAASTACCCLGSGLSLMAAAFSFYLMFFALRDSKTASVWADRAADNSLPSDRSRCSTRGWVTFDAELKENGASSDGLGRPYPPRQARRPRRSRSTLLTHWPVIAGIKSLRITPLRTEYRLSISPLALAR